MPPQGLAFCAPAADSRVPTASSSRVAQRSPSAAPVTNSRVPAPAIFLKPPFVLVVLKWSLQVFKPARMQDLLAFWPTLPPLVWVQTHVRTHPRGANSAMLTHLNRHILLSGGGAGARTGIKRCVSVFPTFHFWAYRWLELLFLDVVAFAFAASIITRSQPFLLFSMLVSVPRWYRLCCLCYRAFAILSPLFNVSRCCRLCCQRYHAFATRLHLFDTFTPCFILPVKK